MAEKSRSFLDIADFGTPVAPAQSPVVSQKQQSVAAAADTKKTVLGPQEDLYALAIGSRNENRIAQTEMMQDLDNLSYGEFLLKHGEEAANNLHRYKEQKNAVDMLDVRKRSNWGTTKDTALEAGSVVTSMAGGLLALGLAAREQHNELVRKGVNAVAGQEILKEGPVWSDDVSRWTQQASDWFQSKKTDLQKERRQRHAIEGAFNEADSQAQFQEDLATGANPLAARATKIGRDIAWGVGNFMDDPSMVGEAAVSGAASMAPQTAAIRAIGAARALGSLTAKGMTKEAAKAHLKTEAGKALLNNHMLRAVPLVTGVTEGSGALTQAQQEVLAMSEAELAQVPAYQELRSQGRSHDDAVGSLARDAGFTAALVGGTIGAGAGMISRAFEVNPLPTGAARTGVTAPASAAAGNVAKETVEEGLQEGGNQLASNVGLNAAGIERSLDDGLGTAIAEGMVAGAATAGGMQAPGAALGTLNELGRAGANRVSEAVEKSEARLAEQQDAASPVGTNAQASASQQAEEAVQTIASQAQAEGAAPEVQQIAQAAEEALYLSPKEFEEQAPLFERLQEEAGPDGSGRVKRTTLIEEAGKILEQKDVHPLMKLNAAVQVLDSLSKVRRAEQDAAEDALEALPEDNPIRENKDVLSSTIQTITSSKAAEDARSYAENLTQEEFASLLPVDDYAAGKTTPEETKSISEIIEILGSVNPSIVSESQYSQALNQLGADSPQLRASLETARATAAAMQAAEAELEVIDQEQETIVEAQPELKSQVRKTHDIVREEIHEDGNSDNAMPSLREHRQRFMTAVREGKSRDAQSALIELGNFARSQIGKLEAMNASAEEGQGTQKTFQAYGPHGFFEQAGPYAQPKSLNSVAQIRETWVDAKALADTYNAQLEAYKGMLGDLAPELKAGPLTVPDVHPSMSFENFKGNQTTPNQVAPDQTEVQEAPDAAAEQVPVVEEVADNAQEAQVQTAEENPIGEDLGEAVAAESTAEPVATQEGEGSLPEGSTEQPAPRRSLGEVFDATLVKTKGGSNKFLEAFERKQDGSSFLDHDAPSQFLADTADNLHKVAGTSIGTPITPEQSETLKAMVSDNSPLSMKSLKPVVDGLIQGAFDKTKQVGKEKRETTRLKELLAGDERALSYDDALSANLTTLNKDGKLEMEPRVFEAASMAALQWLTEESNRGDRRYDDEHVNQVFGLPRTHPTTTAMRDAVASGTPAQAAMEGIARNFTELMGLTGKKGAPENITQGVPLALAATMLEALDQAGLIKLDKKAKVPTGKGTKPRDLNVLALPEDGDVSRFAKTFRSKPDVFSRAFLPDRGVFRHIGKPPQSVPNHVIRNKFRELTAKEKKVIDRLQKTPYRLNVPLMRTIWAMDPANAIRLMGWKPLREDRMNVNTLASQKGKNQSLESGYNAVMGYYEEMETYASEHDMPLEEVEAFFGMEISSVGRLQQQGPVTPQGDKIARELLTATNSTLDLTDPAQEQLHWLAVAQSLDVSIEKMQPEDAIAEARNRALVNFGPAVEILRDLENRLLEDPESELTPEEQGALVEAIEAGAKASDDMEVTMKALHALHVVARAENALSAENPYDRENFQTSLAIEADGKTDGPINAMIHMATGPFTEHQIRIWEKGGLLITDDPIALNDHIAGNEFREQDKEDLYHVAASLFDQHLPEFLSTFTEPSEKQASDAVMEALNVLLDGFQLGSPTSRNVLKNPLTVFLYGSGSRGIAQKLVNSSLDTLYGEMTQAMEAIKEGNLEKWQDHPFFADNPNLFPALEALMNIEVVRGEGGKKILKQRQRPIRLNLSNPLQFTLPPEGTDNMADLVDMFFAQPMLESIDEATGGLVTNMKLIQRASQVQAEVFTGKFNELLEARRQEKGLDNSELLSREETEEVFREAMELAPIYGTDVQSFHIAAPGRQQDGRDISRSITGKLPAKAKVQHPTEASVKVQPYMVIGMGDGRMMINIYADGDGSLNASLPVFDGVELALATAADASKQINKAVWDAWMDGNIMEAVAEGFDQLILRREVQGEEMTELAEQLRKAADEIKIRKKVMQSVNARVDHMAGLKAAYENKGDALGVPSFLPATERNRLVANAMNRRRAREEAKEAAAKEKKPAVQKPNKAFEQTVQRAGETVEGYDATMVRGDRIAKLLTHQTGGTNEQTEVFHKLLKNQDRFKDITVFVGSPEELTRLRDDLGFESDHPVQLGQAFVDKDTIFVANAAPETLLHELLHVYTYRQLVDHYSGAGVAPAMKGAIERLEHLYKDFWKLDVSQEPKAVREAFAQMQDQLRNPTMGKAERMTEFLAWTLSNQNLIELGKKTRTTSPVLRIMKEAMELLRKILRLPPGSTLHSNIRFNADILVAYSRDRITVRQATQEQELRKALDQAYGSDPAVSDVERRFLGKLVEHIKVAYGDKSGPESAAVTKAHAALKQAAQNATDLVQEAGFALNPREANAFKAVYSTMMSGARMNPSAMRRLNRIYGHVLRDLKAEDFLTEGATEAEKEAAQSKVDLLVSDTRRDKRNRSDLVPIFLALGMVNQEFKDVLSRKEAPKDIVPSGGGIDGALRAIARSIVNLLTRLSLGREVSGRTADVQLAALGQALSEVKHDNRVLAAMHAFQPVERVNKAISGAVKNGANKALEKLEEVRKGTTSRTVNTAALIGEAVLALGSKSASESFGNFATKFMNDHPNLHTARRLIEDLRGMTKDNAAIMRLMNVVKAQIDAFRQDYREKIPEVLADQFSRKLKREEWSRMYQGLGNADLLALGLDEATDLIKDPSKLAAQIKDAEAQIKALGGRNAAKQQEKAKALATYLVTGKVTSRALLRNAEAISVLAGDGSVDLIKAIDRLISLYAFDMTDAGTKDTLKELVEQEAEGMQVVMGYLRALREAELAKAPAGDEGQAMRLNGWKGHIPTVTQEGHAIVVREDRDFAELERKGYVRVGDYAGDRNEQARTRRGYYMTTVGDRNAFRQGIAQTVHSSYMGVDARNGRTMGNQTAGVIWGTRARQIKGRVRREDGLAPGEYLLPIFDKEGEVVGYEQSLAPEQVAKVRQDMHLGRMLGVWAGRMLEERVADEFNTKLVQTLKEDWDKREPGTDDEFVNVADPKQKDPIYKDAWDTLGWKIKQDAQKIFGRGGFFPVRRNMVEDAVGYRAAAVTDPWSGISRWSPETQEKMKKAATFILGKGAYRYLRVGSNAVEDAVSMAKTTIIVRAVTVAFENIISNMGHMLIHGIDPITLTKGLRDKFVEVTEYTRNRERYLELETELAAYKDDTPRAKRIQAEMKALSDANERMSIAPLIKAGEFSTVSENLTEADVAIREGRFGDYLEKAADKLPKPLQTAAKTLAITKDTALFQGLNRMVQYGDFVSKAVLYDHLKKKGEKTEQEILDEISEEFVNYNRLAGRGRDFLESMGLLWFWNYKLRIQKIALKTMREKPFTALTFGMGTLPEFDIDTVMSGSLAGAAWDGRLGYSVGPEMGLNSWTLHPVVNILD